MSKVLSNRPDEMTEGLISDFDGKVTLSRYVATSLGSGPKGLYGRLTIQPLDDSMEPFNQHWSAGKIADFVPSMDGEESTDIDNDEDDSEGIYIISPSGKEKMSKLTNWGALMKSLVDAGFPLDKIVADVRFLEGGVFHFDRFDQPDRSKLGGTNDPGDKKRTFLLVTEIKQMPGAKTGVKKAGASAATSTAKVAAKPKPAAEPEENADDSTEGTDEFETSVVSAISGILAKAEGEAVPRKTVMGEIMTKFVGKDKKPAVALAGDRTFVGHKDRPWLYDADDDTLMGTS